MEFDLDNEEKICSSVEPDLVDSERVKFDVNRRDFLEVEIEADSLGSFRGSLNTATKLVKLSSKIIGDFNE